MGSPNPMLSRVALARRTAQILVPAIPPPVLQPNFQWLLTEVPDIQRWSAAGPGSFALIDGNLVAEPGGDHTVFFYAAQRFGDFVLRAEFLIPGPVNAFGTVDRQLRNLCSFQVSPHRLG